LLFGSDVLEVKLASRSYFVFGLGLGLRGLSSFNITVIWLPSVTVNLRFRWQLRFTRHGFAGGFVKYHRCSTAFDVTDGWTYEVGSLHPVLIRLCYLILQEIAAALEGGCNIIPVMDNFQWPPPETLPDDMRPICYFNSIR